MSEFIPALNREDGSIKCKETGTFKEACECQGIEDLLCPCLCFDRLAYEPNRGFGVMCKYKKQESKYLKIFDKYARSFSYFEGDKRFTIAEKDIDKIAEEIIQLFWDTL